MGPHGGPPPWVVVRALGLVNALHERMLLSVLLERESARKGTPPPTPLVNRETANQPAQRLVYALWRAARVALQVLGKPPMHESVRALADEVDRTVLTPQLAEMTGGFLRAVELRLQAG